MRYAFGLALLIMGCSTESSNRQPKPRPVADLVITGGQIVDVRTGQLINGHSIVINGDRIDAIVVSEDAPESAREFAADGHFIIPGLWDMHAHALYEKWPLTDDGEPYTWGPYMDLMLAHGVTGFRDMWGTPGAIRQARAEIASGDRAGPRFIAAGLTMGWFEYMAGLEKAQTEAEARALVRKAKSDGADFIKFGLYNPAYLLAPVVDEARTLGLDVVGHVPPDMTATEAAETGMRSLEHSFGVIQGCTADGEGLFEVARLEFQESGTFSFPMILHSDPLLAEFDEVACSRQAKQLAMLEVWLGPTVALWEAKANAASIDIETDPRFELVNAGDRDIWIDSHEYWRGRLEETGDLTQRLYDVRLRLIKTMHDNGVSILAGSDFMNLAATPGMGLIDELRNYQKAGLSPLDALRTATVEPARYLRQTDDFGAIEAGKIADLVFLSKNPLEDIENVATTRAVVAAGTLLDRNALDRLIDNAKKSLH